MKMSPSKLRDSSAAMDYSFNDAPCVYFIQSVISKNCYVGSSINVKNRVRTHFSDLLKGEHHCEPLQRAFDKYGPDNFVWGMCEFVYNKDELLEAEQRWIDQIGDYNTCLVAGSISGIKMNLSDEERERRRLVGKNLAASLSDEQIEYALSRAVAAKIGKPLSDAQKAKISATTKGRPLTPAHRAKLSEINKARQHTEEELKRRGESIRKALSARSPEKIAEWKSKVSSSKTGVPSAKRGIPMSEESRKKMSIAGKGKVISEAQKEKLRVAMLAKSPEWYAMRAEKIRAAKARKKQGA